MIYHQSNLEVKYWIPTSNRTITRKWWILRFYELITTGKIFIFAIKFPVVAWRETAIFASQVLGSSSICHSAPGKKCRATKPSNSEAKSSKIVVQDQVIMVVVKNIELSKYVDLQQGTNLWSFFIATVAGKLGFWWVFYDVHTQNRLLSTLKIAVSTKLRTYPSQVSRNDYDSKPCHPDGTLSHSWMMLDVYSPDGNNRFWMVLTHPQINFGKLSSWSSHGIPSRGCSIPSLGQPTECSIVQRFAMIVVNIAPGRAEVAGCRIQSSSVNEELIICNNQKYSNNHK